MSSIRLTHPITPPNGVGARQWDFVRGPDGRLFSIVFPKGETIDFTYDNGRIATLTDRRGKLWQYSYSGSKCTQVKAPARTHPTTGVANFIPTTTFSWSSGNTSVRLKGFSGNQNVYAYTAKVKDPYNRETKHIYFDTKYNGAFAGQYAYIDRPISRIEYPTVNGTTPKEEMTWDLETGLVDETWDALLTRTTYLWDTPVQYGSTNVWSAFGDLKRKTVHDTISSPDIDYSINYTYTANHMPLEVVKMTGQRTKYTYDATGTRVTLEQVYDDMNSVLAVEKHWSYDADGRMLQSWVGNDPATTYGDFHSYTDLPRLINTPYGSTTIVYDSLGRKAKETRGVDKHWEWIYDINDQVTEELVPALTPTTPYAERVTKYYYDGNNNVTQKIDRKGTSTHYQYDNEERVTGTIIDMNANGILTDSVDIAEYKKYDLVGNPIVTTNATGQVTDTTYDDFGRITQIALPDGTTREFQYNINGNVTSTWDGKGNRIDNLYDGLNRPYLSKYYRQTTPGNYALDLTVERWFHGENQSERARSETRAGVTRQFIYGHNGAEQLTSVYNPYANKTVSYTYEPLTGRRKTMSVGTQTWTYDFYNTLPWKVSQSLGNSIPVQYAYNAEGQLTDRFFGNATAIHNDYDRLDRMFSSDHYNGLTVNYVGSGILQQSTSFQFDPEGNVLRKFNEVPGQWKFEDNLQYDRAHRLKQESRTRTIGSTITPLYTSVYNYDNAGNRTSVVRTNHVAGTTNPVAQQTYVHTIGDRFRSGEGFSVPNNPSTGSANYDANGSPLSMIDPAGMTSTFQYDVQNNLKQITRSTGGTADSFEYDSTLKRMSKTDASGTRYYIYDGDTIIAELQTPGGTIDRYFLAGVGEVSSAGAQTYYVEDTFGTNVGVTDSTGAAGANIAQAEFDAYGRPTPVQGTVPTNRRFGGRHGYMTDDSSGLILCGARYYIPALGRFLTQDPSGQEDGLNLYRYCHNNPLGSVDPDGRQASSVGDFIRLSQWIWNGGLWDLAPQNDSWMAAKRTTMLFEDGIGPTVYNYKGLSDPRVQDVRSSHIGTMINRHIGRSSVEQLRNGIKGSVGSAEAFANTLWDFSNGTQAQLGAVTYAVKLNGHVLDFHVANVISRTSMFYHAPGLSNNDRRYIGDKYSNVYQHFYWSVRSKW